MTTAARANLLPISPLSARASVPPGEGSASESSAGSELVAGGRAADRSPNQPAPTQRERLKHVLATVAPPIRRGGGSVVRALLGKAPDPHRHPTSFEADPTHAAREEEGHFQIANVWASEEDANNANSNPEFLAALESAGISLDSAEMEQTELHNFFSKVDGLN